MVARKLTALPGFADDIAALPSDALRRQVFGLLVEIQKEVLEGKPLDSRISTGDLGDCFKLYFDTDGSQKPRFRLVYRLVDESVNVVAVEAVAAGRRTNLEAYVTAGRRLGRDA